MEIIMANTPASSTTPNPPAPAAAATPEEIVEKEKTRIEELLDLVRSKIGGKAKVTEVLILVDKTTGIELATVTLIGAAKYEHVVKAIAAGVARVERVTE